MVARALLKFVQAPLVGGDGQALLGKVGTSVSLSNVDNANVASWQIDLVWADPDSSVVAATPFAFSDNGSTPSASFLPDVKSSFRFVLKVWSVTSRVGDPDDVDIRVFAVQDGDFIIPPPQLWPEPLPDPRSGLPKAKPNELNFGGQLYGWAGDGRTDVLASSFLRKRGGTGILVTAVKSVDVSGATLSAVTEVGDIFTSNTNGPISIGSYGTDWRAGDTFLPNVVLPAHVAPTVFKVLDPGSSTTPYVLEDTGRSPAILISDDPGLPNNLWSYPSSPPGVYSTNPGGGLVVDGSPVQGYVVAYPGSGTHGVWAPPGGLTISSFVCTTPLVETGATIVNPAFTAAENIVPTGLVLTNSANGEAKDVHLTPTSFSSSQTYLSSVPGHVDTFTLTGTSPGSSDAVRNTTMTRAQRNYAGKVTIGNTSISTLVAAATFNALDLDGSFSFTVTDDGSHEVQFAIPARFTLSTIKDHATGFGIGVTLVATSSFTNGSGFSENYKLYKFDSAVGSSGSPVTLTADVVST